MYNNFNFSHPHKMVLRKGISNQPVELGKETPCIHVCFIVCVEYLGRYLHCVKKPEIRNSARKGSSKNTVPYVCKWLYNP